MNNDVLQTIAERRSHRAYVQEALDEEKLQAILKAALQSPSATNRQPWHFSVVQDPELIQEIHVEAVRAFLVQGDPERAARFKDSGHQIFFHAPTVIFVFGEKGFSWTQVDCGIAVQNMALAAESLGVGSVILGMPKAAFMGEKGDALRSRLSCPEGYDFVVALALGRAADTKDAHDLRPEKITRIH